VIELTITSPEAATPEEAAAVLTRIVPEPGTYELRGPGPRRRQVAFDGPVGEAADPLAIFERFFPEAGTYAILKARPPRPPGVPSEEGGPAFFVEWWMERLAQEAAARAMTLREFMLAKLSELLAAHAGRLPAPAVLEALDALLFDFRLAVRWSVAMPLTAEQVERLQALGFSDRDVLDWPGLAYRFGLIEQALATQRRVPFTRLLDLAARAPVQTSDQVAITYARAKAAQYLTPIVLREPERAAGVALDRERALIQRMTAEAIRRETNPRQLAREFARTLRPEGFVRDFDRLARTEMQTARLQGAFAAEARARDWTAETHVYRSLAARPCQGCVRLYAVGGDRKRPQLYTVGAVQAGDALGPNTRPWREWHVVVGATHPNCLCGPWITWNDALRAIFPGAATAAVETAAPVED
jgi:hypothetical protein